MVRNRILRVCFYFVPRYVILSCFFPPEKGSERNYGSLLLFLFHGMEFRVVFSSAERFGRNSKSFLFWGIARIASERCYDFVEITMCLLSANAAEAFRTNYLSIMINPLNFEKWGILEQSMGAKNRVGIGLSYIGWWNRFIWIDSWAP